MQINALKSNFQISRDLRTRYFNKIVVKEILFYNNSVSKESIKRKKKRKKEKEKSRSLGKQLI